MEFQFRTDITGLPVAKCDIECEAFGDWLSHDLSINKTKIKSLLETIDKLLNKQLNHYEYTGKEYHLIFEDDEVKIMLNHNQTSESEFAETYDHEMESGCGLVDFQHLLLEWQRFIR
jgi:uncharacterized protein YacL (UPF0231 family)